MKNKKIMLLVIFLLIMVVAFGCTTEPVEDEPELNPDENVVVEDNTMPNDNTEVEMEQESPPMDTNTETNQ